MAERFQLPPLITASTWANVADALWTQSRRGSVQDDAGDMAPKWTNREAAALVSALRGLGKSAPGGFPWWYQFAAAAYGWEPSNYKDHLLVNAAQADGIYPPETAVMLNREIARITTGLDTVTRPDPRMELIDVFDDEAFMSDVMQALHEDGSNAQFKIPLPACKAEGGRKLRPPVWDRRERRWKCPDGVAVIDDPLTALVKALIKPAAVIAAVYLLATGIPVALDARRKRRKRKRDDHGRTST